MSFLAAKTLATGEIRPYFASRGSVLTSLLLPVRLLLFGPFFAVIPWLRCFVLTQRRLAEESPWRQEQSMACLLSR